MSTRCVRLPLLLVLAVVVGSTAAGQTPAPASFDLASMVTDIELALLDNDLSKALAIEDVLSHILDELARRSHVLSPHVHEQYRKFAFDSQLAIRQLFMRRVIDWVRMAREHLQSERFSDACDLLLSASNLWRDMVAEPNQEIEHLLEIARAGQRAPRN